MGQTKEALDLLDGFVKKNPNDAQTVLYRGRVRMELGQTEDGIKDLQKATQLQPRWGLAQYYLGMAYLQNGKVELAEASLNSAAQLDNTLLGARLALAELDLGRGKSSKALADLDKTIARKPKAVEPYLLHALALAQTGEEAKAEKELLPLVDEFPEPAARAMTYRALALSKMRQKQFNEAHNYAKLALKNDATSPEALYVLGVSLMQQKKNDAALAEVGQYVKDNPKWAPGYEVLGQLEMQAGQLPKAEESLQKAVELDSKLTSAQLRLGELQVTEGKLDQATETLTKLSQAQPTLPDPYVFLGQICELKKDWSGAEANYKKGLELAPNNLVAKNNLAWVYAEHGGNIDTALRLAQEAKEAQPDSPSISDTLAWIFVKKQSYDSAIRLLKDCVDKKPESALYRYHLGVAYYKAGQKSQAEQSLQAALRIQPNFSESNDAKHLLEDLSK
jgi:tetratricopeptide (TPR) repeat protein